MYLIDTNVWLERLLGQARSDEVGQLFNYVTSKGERVFVDSPRKGGEGRVRARWPVRSNGVEGELP